jgi:hypothetical protein
MDLVVLATVCAIGVELSSDARPHLARIRRRSVVGFGARGTRSPRPLNEAIAGAQSVRGDVIRVGLGI